ncbi:GyrI-like domain-containing protein [Paenibacillus sp. FSL H8-0259]|uniref:AraC family transcriptional regulator n=1 Tax=Paenibacillus sp. FSL H8-0259 TaxID=1920423 RepID=UPI0026B258A2|nr:GyrI-like domain-containing protein [Paenibacillus sp. FSL H8-0259]
MKIQLQTLPVTRIAYVRQTGPYGPGNSKAMGALKEWARAHRLLTGSAILFGIPQDNPDTTLPEHCRYDACISVLENAPADKSINYGEIPGGTYAVVTIQHTLRQFKKHGRRSSPPSTSADISSITSGRLWRDIQVI